MIIPTSNITLFNLSVMRGIIDSELEKYIISRPGKFHCRLEPAQLSFYHNTYNEVLSLYTKKRLSQNSHQFCESPLISYIIKHQTQNQ